MAPFQQANVEDKLILMMAAINKINTYFYYKFNSLQKQLTNDVDGVIPTMKVIKRTTKNS